MQWKGTDEKIVEREKSARSEGQRGSKPYMMEGKGAEMDEWMKGTEGENSRRYAGERNKWKG